MLTSVDRGKNSQCCLTQGPFLASSSIAGKNDKLLEMLFGDPKNHMPMQFPCFRLYAKSADYF